MLISELPTIIRIIAKKRLKQQGREYDPENSIVDDFTWCETPEGNDVWSDVDDGNYDSFYEFRKQRKKDKQCTQ